MPTIAIDQISIGTNRRALKEGRVSELVESIRANGLLNPITVDSNLKLVAGLHRLTACKLLGLKEIECTILAVQDDDHARLAEIDENLIRSELDALERAELWLERDQILDRMGLRAKQGDNQYTQRGSEIISPPLKTTLELAKEAGYTDRTFQLGKQIARDIAPEIKAKIKGTPIAKSTTGLLKIARAGSQARKQAEQAEQAARQAQHQKQQAQLEKQVQIIQEARTKQQELQLIVLQNTIAEKAAKSFTKQGKLSPKPSQPPILFSVQPGDEWLLDRHLVYCGATHEPEFIDRLPSNAALAIATFSNEWQHDYLIDEARVVAVICLEGTLHTFCRSHHLPFRFEFFFGNLYLAVFSQQPFVPPEKPTSVDTIESAIAYLVSLYTKPGNYVIGTALGYGELLSTCERLGRVCFTGDPSPERLNHAIDRWQKLSGKQAKKLPRGQGVR